jgi:hypothetical protein
MREKKSEEKIEKFEEKNGVRVNKNVYIFFN